MNFKWVSGIQFYCWQKRVKCSIELWGSVWILKKEESCRVFRRSRTCPSLESQFKWQGSIFIHFSPFFCICEFIYEWSLLYELSLSTYITNIVEYSVLLTYYLHKKCSFRTPHSWLRTDIFFVPYTRSTLLYGNMGCQVSIGGIQIR